MGARDHWRSRRLLPSLASILATTSACVRPIPGGGGAASPEFRKAKVMW